jgi:A/G-specific adenine glycosylase
MKRPAKGIWGGLFCFPELEGKADNKAIRAFCREHYQLLVEKPSPLPGFRHSFTHYHLDISPVVITLGARQSLKADVAIKAQIWYNPSKPSTIGMPKPVQLLMGKLP